VSAAVSLVPTLTLFAMMLALGMELQGADFRRLLDRPRALLLGASAQLMLLPVVALVLVHLLALPPAVALGLMLLAACPGGATSNMLSRYAGGDVALSISLTAFSSLVAPVWIPLMLTVGLHAVPGVAADVDLSVPGMIGGLVVTTVVPVLLGMGWLRAKPARAERLRRPLLAVSTVVLIALIVGLGINTVRIHGDPAGMFSRSLGAVLAFLAAGVAVAGVAAKLAGVSAAQQRTLLLEVAIQNINLALVVAVTILDEPRYLGPTLVYLPVMLLFALVLVLVSRRTGKVR
jgi:bile acid:Na+ symporter, BASS family